MAGEVKEQRVVMDYYIVRQREGGATVAGRLPAENAQALAGEVEAIVRSIAVGAPK